MVFKGSECRAAPPLHEVQKRSGLERTSAEHLMEIMAVKNRTQSLIGFGYGAFAEYHYIDSLALFEHLVQFRPNLTRR